MSTSIKVDSIVGSDGYTITDHKYGKLIQGAVPLRDMTVLLSAWAEQAEEEGGFATLHAGIAKAMHATAAIAFNQDAWLADIEERNSTITDVELRWLTGPHTGLSSLTIFRALAKREHASCARASVGAGYLPADGDDWLRCYRVVEDCGFLDRLDDLAAKDPRWVPWVNAWASLSAITKAYLENTGSIQTSLGKKLDKFVAEVDRGNSIPSADTIRKIVDRDIG